MNSHEVFIHIHQGCFAVTGAIVRLPQCQWSKPDGYGKISQCITTTKHSKSKTVCIFLGIYCILRTRPKPEIEICNKTVFCCRIFFEFRPEHGSHTTARYKTSRSVCMLYMLEILRDFNSRQSLGRFVLLHIMTPSNGNILSATATLYGESTWRSPVDSPPKGQ